MDRDTSQPFASTAIGPHTVELWWVDGLAAIANLNGSAQRSANPIRINIDSEATGSVLVETVVHEMLHIASDSLGDGLDEPVVYRMGLAMAQLLAPFVEID